MAPILAKFIHVLANSVQCHDHTPSVLVKSVTKSD